MDIPLSRVLREIVRRYGVLLVLLPLMGGVAAGAFAFLTPKKWTAYQSISVRDELVGTATRPGRFDSADQLRAAQETLRTVARHRSVVERVLSKLEPPTGYKDAQWPSEEYLEDYGGNIGISAANGAEFGQTDVVVLTVTDQSPERATQVVAFLTQEIAAELASLRDTRFSSMENELTSGLRVAQQSVNQASTELNEFERKLGADLSEMRSMNDPSGSEGPLRRQLGTTRQDIVTANQRLGDLNTQLNYLQSMLDSPASIVSTPESILAVHPELRRLKEGIIDAAVKLSDLRAKYEKNHPLVIAADSASRSLSAELRLQLDSAVKGTQFERDVILTRVQELRMVETDLTDRITLLSAKRVDYSDLAHRVERRKIELARTESELTEVQAAREAASLAAVISPIGMPRADTRPSGPGRSTIAAAGGAGGLVLAIGIIAILFDPRSIATRPADAASSISLQQASAAPHEPVANPQLVAPQSTLPYARSSEASAQSVHDALPVHDALQDHDALPDHVESYATDDEAALVAETLEEQIDSYEGIEGELIQETEGEGEATDEATTWANALADLQREQESGTWGEERADEEVPPVAISPVVPTPTALPPTLAESRPETRPSSVSSNQLPTFNSATKLPSHTTATLIKTEPQVSNSRSYEAERERWQALEQLSSELSELENEISQRRSKVLAEELARYQSPEQR